MTTLHAALDRAAHEARDRIALRLDDRTVTYGALREQGARAAALLERHGVGHGDRVAVMLPNVPEAARSEHRTMRAQAQPPRQKENR